MKNVLLILVLLGGFVMTASAQAKCEPANCAPCPPGCCIIKNCCPKGAAASAQEKQGDVLFVSMLNVDQKDVPTTCTKKEMKACAKACKAQSRTAVTAGFNPATPCQPKTATIEVQPTTQKVSMQKS